MTFKAKLDDAESRAFWDAVERGAKAYVDLPSWQKGIVRGVESTADSLEAHGFGPVQAEAAGDPSED